MEENPQVIGGIIIGFVSGVSFTLLFVLFRDIWREYKKSQKENHNTLSNT